MPGSYEYDVEVLSNDEPISINSPYIVAGYMATDGRSDFGIQIDRIEAKLDRIIAELDDDEASRARFREIMEPK